MAGKTKARGGPIKGGLKDKSKADDDGKGGKDKKSKDKKDTKGKKDIHSFPTRRSSDLRKSVV